MSESIVPEVEEWRPVAGWEGVYEASSHGRVRRIKRGANTFRGRVLQPNLTKDGYLQTTLSDASTNRHVGMTVHRVIALAFIGEKPFGNAEVNHIDGNKTNNKPSNLEYVTPKENNNHARRTGLMIPVFGEGVSYRGTKDCDVLKIREMYATGRYSCKALAKAFSLSKSSINYIVNSRNWKHLDKCSNDEWMDQYSNESIAPRKYDKACGISHNGKTMAAAAWAKELGISKCQISNRYNGGWPIELVLKKLSRREVIKLGWKMSRPNQKRPA